MKSCRFLSCVVLIPSAVGLVRSTHVQPLRPLDFASLGTLNLAAGDFVIDTDALTITDATGGGSTLHQGLSFPEAATF